MPQPGYAPAPTGPTIRFDVIGQAFNMVFADAGTWIVSAIVVAVIVVGLNFLIGMVTIGMILSGAWIVGLFLRFVSIGVIAAIQYIFIANMFRMAIKAISGVKPSVNDLFKFEDVGNVVLAAFVVGFVTVIGCMFCVIPGLLFAGVTMFTLPLVVDRKVPAMAAISQSIEILKKDIVMASLLILVASICSWILLGLTMAVLPISVALLYRDYVGFASDPAHA
ncbi:MAG TPA: hypothetical protein VHE55_16425 [Fimbriimonadaceae bacterium]|nr:hypothetical protein [Fimbriimonadaceae bacterium]